MGLFQLLHIVGMSTQKEPSLLCTLLIYGMKTMSDSLQVCQEPGT